jgi:UDP-N-acetylmuramate: L-alanyl-gamma-D-glutamyl-meso-diaminopimelate ligase
VAKAARCRITTYARPGFSADWSFEVSGTKPEAAPSSPSPRAGRSIGTVETGMPGLYNFENLVGISALATRLGVDIPSLAKGVHRFLGVRRRQEVRGVAAGVTVVDDFAHHPTAIHETLLALKGRHGPGKLIAAFEPRSATSRRNVFQQGFAESLAVADEVVLAPLYAPEKVPAAERLDVERLAADLRGHDTPARLIAGVDATAQHIASRAAPGDTVVIMSSGDYGGPARQGAVRAGRSGALGRATRTAPASASSSTGWASTTRCSAPPGPSTR